MTTEPAPIDALVIDAGPLIRSDFTSQILSRVSKVYTTPSVIAEIRDAATRSRLETTWFTFITQRTPKAASVRVVSGFAKKTGDFPVLSVTDLQLLALTYELEVELNGGDWRLRRVPGQKGVNGPIPKKAKAKEEESTKEAKDERKTVPAQSKRVAGENDDDQTGDISQRLEKTRIASDMDAPLGSLQEVELHPPRRGSLATEEEPQPVEEAVSPASDSDSGSDSGWITPSNIHKYQAKEAHAPVTTSTSSSKTERFPIRAALATTDFALQNVLLQMNLHLISPTTLYRIKQIRSFVLRCHACFKITRDMTRQFCPTCGGPTLQRVSCSTSSTGEFRLHLKRNYQWNNRGNVYSLPKPQHGSASGKGVKGNLILREDQKEYEREVRKEERRKERDLFDPDYLPGILTGERRGATGRPTIGYGKSNPNARKQGGKR